MTPNKLCKLSVTAGLCMTTSFAMASPQAFMSARSFAMGGTGVAVAHPSAAPSANPAMMAAEQHDWADDFGLMLPSVNARAADEEEIIDQVDNIQDQIDQFEALKFSSPADAQAKARELVDDLEAFNRDTLRADIGLGIGLAIPTESVSFGFFTNGNLTATVRGELDDDDLDLLSGIANGVILPSATDLNTDLGSKGRILASAVVEAGISIATNFSLNEKDSVQVGISPKYVQLQTFQYTQDISDFEDDDFDGDQYQTDKSGFNLDIGAAYAFGTENQWNTGVVIKNLIPTELDSARSRPDLEEEQYSLELNPMVTAGIAHKGEYHVVTAELDLTKKEAFGYEDDTQWLALGAEFDAWRYAQLRTGLRHNLASNNDNDGIEEDTQFTAGLGLNIVGVRIDIGALYSSADVGAALELGTAF